MRLPTSDSTVVKTLKVLLWTGVSAIVVKLFAMVQANPSLFNPYMVVIVNVFGKMVVEFLNSETPNY